MPVLAPQAGAIPDDQPPPEMAGGPAARASVAAANARPMAMGAAVRPPVEPTLDAEPEGLMAAADGAIKLGMRGLNRIFGLTDTGGVPTPEGAQGVDSGIRRFAAGEGAATKREIQAIDATMGVEDYDVDEGMKNLIRIDKTVQYYLQKGDKDKAEAVAASLLLYGAGYVKKSASAAAGAFEQYQKTGDPQDLRNATMAMERAYSAIPDGIDLKIDVDPKTRQLVATTLTHDGSQKKQVIDPQMVPQILKAGMDGSGYWEALMMIGQPGMAKQRQAGMDAAALQEDRQAFTVQNEQTKADRQAQIEDYQHYRDREEGESAGERKSYDDQVFFDDWSRKMAEQPSRELVEEGMGYAFDRAPDVERPVDSTTLAFDPASEQVSTYADDMPQIQQIAGMLASKNGVLDGNAAMLKTAELIQQPNITPTSDGRLDVGGLELVFNPTLLPALMQLRGKYRQPTE